MATPSRSKYNQLRRKGVNLETLRNDLRQNFYKRLKSARCTNADRLRKILDNQDVGAKFRNMIELKKIIMTENMKHEDAEEVLKLIEDIEGELLDLSLEWQACEHETDETEEIETSVQCLLENTYCIICDQISRESLCHQCAADFNEGNTSL